jgi:hypothetical protein
MDPFDKFLLANHSSSSSSSSDFMKALWGARYKGVGGPRKFLHLLMTHKMK